MACAGITKGAAFDCSNPLVPGVNTRLLLANKDDVETFTFSVTPGEENVITGITMKSGKAFFSFEGSRGTQNSVNPQYTLVRGTILPLYDHQIDYSVFDISASQKLNLEAMGNKQMVAIVQNAEDSGNQNNFFEVYGQGVGMVVTENTRIPGDADTAGAFVLQLKTPDDGRETTMPPTFFTTDFTTTLAAVNALLTPAP